MFWNFLLRFSEKKSAPYLETSTKTEKYEYSRKLSNIKICIFLRHEQSYPFTNLNICSTVLFKPGMCIWHWYAPLCIVNGQIWLCADRFIVLVSVQKVFIVLNITIKMIELTWAFCYSILHTRVICTWHRVIYMYKIMKSLYETELNERDLAETFNQILQLYIYKLPALIKISFEGYLYLPGAL